jgi:membrane-associated phospholipid phosphatase
MSRHHREPSSRNGRARLAGAFAVGFFRWLMCAGVARADDGNAPAPPPEPVTPRVELRYSLWLDVGVTAGVAAGATVWALVRPSIVSNECVLCDKPGGVNAVDDWFRTALMRRDSGPATTASDIFGYGLAPLSALGLGTAAAIADRRGDEAAVNALLVTEATAIDIAIDQALLAVVRRERPSFHFISDPDVKEGSRTSGSVSSFPSGHVSAAFAMAASSGMIASMRGYRLAPLVWFVGTAIAGTTAYLRIAADRHYFTDTVAGMGLGLATGIGVPGVFHSPRKWMQHASISTAPVDHGRVIVIGWTM